MAEHELTTSVKIQFSRHEIEHLFSLCSEMVEAATAADQGGGLDANLRGMAAMTELAKYAVDLANELMAAVAAAEMGDTQTEARH